MRAFAEKSFALDATDADGVTLRETLQGLLARAKRPAKVAEYEAELFCPPLPRELTYLWNVFLRLSNRRGSNGFDIDPIGWTEIDAFIRLSGLRLAPWEIALIEMLDDLYRSQRAKALKAKEQEG